MTNLYSRLFDYRQRPTRRPLEDFLTEAFADLFSRLDSEARRSLLHTILPAHCVHRIEAIAPDLSVLELHTQVTVTVESYGKRPDMILRFGKRNLVVIEAKVGAGFQTHTFQVYGDEDEPQVRNQLETYAGWIGSQNSAEDWPGAIVFLTAWTDPPESFKEPRSDGVLACVATWKTIGDWIRDEVSIDDHRLAHAALAYDFRAFLEENSLMTKYPTARDLAAAMLFARSFHALEAMIDDTLDVVAKHVPKLSAGRHLKNDFNSELNLFMGWFPFARALRRRPTLPYLAIGICFELPKSWEADAANLPQHEPFFFVMSADDNERERVSTIFNGVPEGWVTVEDDWHIAACRPVSDFPSDPDKRVDELQVWAKHQVDKLVLCVPDYEKAPAGPVAKEKDVDED